jgi:hypothetical protein
MKTATIVAAAVAAIGLGVTIPTVASGLSGSPAVAITGTGPAGSSSPTTETTGTTETTPTTETRGTTPTSATRSTSSTSSTLLDLSGNCDEAEHAADPECIGVGTGPSPTVRHGDDDRHRSGDDHDDRSDDRHRSGDDHDDGDRSDDDDGDRSDDDDGDRYDDDDGDRYDHDDDDRSDDRRGRGRGSDD